MTAIQTRSGSSPGRNRPPSVRVGHRLERCRRGTMIGVVGLGVCGTSGSFDNPNGLARRVSKRAEDRMSKTKGNAVIGQSGGPTSVINQSLVGAVREARNAPHIDRLFGARH